MSSYTIKIINGLDPDTSDYMRIRDDIKDSDMADTIYQEDCIDAADTLALEPGVTVLKMYKGRKLLCRTKIETKWY